MILTDKKENSFNGEESGIESQEVSIKENEFSVKINEFNNIHDDFDNSISVSDRSDGEQTVTSEVSIARNTVTDNKHLIDINKPGYYSLNWLSNLEKKKYTIRKYKTLNSMQHRPKSEHEHVHLESFVS